MVGKPVGVSVGRRVWNEGLCEPDGSGMYVGNSDGESVGTRVGLGVVVGVFVT